MALILRITNTSHSFSILERNDPLKCFVRLLRQRAPQPGKKREIKARAGTMVRADQCLITQLGLRMHPGLNVRIGEDNTLYSTKPGKVVISCELFRPNMANPVVAGHYADCADRRIYKKYMNVIPEPQSQKYNLIDLI